MRHRLSPDSGHCGFVHLRLFMILGSPVDDRTDWLELSLKLYHTRKLRLGYQQLMAGIPHLADDGAPGAVLLLVAVVIDALELLVIVFHERIERGSARITRLINGCRCALHTLHNSQARKIARKSE